jgi:HEAT repeat protein
MIRPIVLTLGMTFSLGVSSLEAQEKFLGKTADAWGAQLKSGDAKLRRSAAFALGKMGSRAFSVLKVMKVAYANEKDVKVRQTMVFALGEICRDTVSINTDPDLEKLFLGAITDNDAHLRRSAAFALGCLASKSEATRRALDKALTDPEAIVRQNAAFALGQFAESALPSLSEALRDKDSLVKRDAASVLLQMSDGDKVHELLPDLLPLCRDANSEVRRAALNVLVRIVDPKDTQAIPPLRSALDDKDIENKRNAALALSNIGGEETAIALPVLLEAAKNGDPELRRQSVLAIRNIGKSAAAAVPELIRFLRDDKDAKVREHAALALGGIGKAAESAVPILVRKIQDAAENRDVRTECAMALQRIGPVPAAEKAVPALLDVLGNSEQDAKVRERVMWSLRVHRENLRTLKGPLETFSRIMKEPPTEDNKMLRYDCAYMLGMIWQQQAPDHTLDLLREFLLDKGVKVYVDTAASVGGTSTETKGGTGSVKDLGQGDGRVMAADALLSMGPKRYAGRADIMRQLRVLAADAMLYEPLRKKSAALVKAAR